MGALTINYEVPNLELVVQDKNMACWYASVMMLLKWKHNSRKNIFDTKKPTMSFIEPLLDNETIRLYKANGGIKNSQIIPLAKRLGLVAIPPMSPTIEALRSWLQMYGPLWTNGKSHIVVIAGIRGDPQSGFTVKVYDPWPGNGISWRTLDGWYTGRDSNNWSASSRDISNGITAVFLHA